MSLHAQHTARAQRPSDHDPHEATPHAAAYEDDAHDGRALAERGGPAPSAAALHQAPRLPADVVAFTGHASRERFDRNVRVDKQTTVELEDESGQHQADMIRDAVKRAKELVNIALSALNDRKSNKKAIKKHFKTTQRDEVQEIIRNYQKIRAGLNGTVPIEVENKDKGRRGYVTTFLGTAIFSDIHLGAPWFKQAPDKRAGTIIHEMSHKEAGTDDNAYYRDNSSPYQRLDTKDSINNADCYQFFALELVGYNG